MSSTKHLSRRALIGLARAGVEPDDPHLSVCAECREAYEALARFSLLIGREPLEEPPKEMVRKAKKIGHRPSATRLLELAASLIFDSWASPTPVGVRGPSTESNRRVHFEAGDITFELRAEKRAPGWSFVAQCSGGSEVFAVQADSEVIEPDHMGVYQWQSARPPRKMSLRSNSRVIQLTDLKWKRTKPS